VLSDAVKEAASNGDLESQVLQEGVGAYPSKFNMIFGCMKKQQIFVPLDPVTGNDSKCGSLTIRRPIT